MKTTGKHYEETRLTLMLTPEQRQWLEEIKVIANIGYADAVVTGLSLYRGMLDDKRRKSRIIVEHQSGEREEILI